MPWWKSKREKEHVELYRLPAHVRWAMLLARALVLAMALGLAASLLALGGPQGSFVVWYVLVVMWLLVLLRELTFLRARRFAKALTRRECLYCGYSLHGLSQPHPCPECGVIYDEQRLIASLRAAFGIAPPEAV